MSTLCHTPWSVQCNVVEELHKKVLSISRNAPTLRSKQSQAHLELAICYQIGVGVFPYLEIVFQHLRKSLDGNEIAQALYNRIARALKHEVSTTNLDLTFQTESDISLDPYVVSEDYFAMRIRTYQRIGPENSVGPIYFGQLPSRSELVDIVCTGNSSLVSYSLSRTPFSNLSLSKALNGACQRGYFDIAMQLCRFSSWTYQTEEEEPTPIHWLIMFDEPKAKKTRPCSCVRLIWKPNRTLQDGD